MAEMPPIRLSVRRKIEDFMNYRGLTPGEFGRRSVNDRKIIPRLRSGKNVTLSRIESMLEFIARESATGA